jgi:SAM-dependent methyltransferase
MSFQLTDVVPWGRTLAEYSAMFNLGRSELGSSILGCGDGPASFNAEATEQGYRVVSADPIYRFSVTELKARIDETAKVVADQLRGNASEFVWEHFDGPESLVSARQEAMSRFLQDYPIGLQEGRYVEATLPNLPFLDQTFDLSLCSHFLFLYSQQNDLDFHVAAITELCRVSAEVRVFPLMELGSVLSRHLDNVLCALQDAGHSVERVRVPYEFQRGANEMLRIVPSNK